MLPSKRTDSTLEEKKLLHGNNGDASPRKSGTTMVTLSCPHTHYGSIIFFLYSLV